MNRRKYEWKVYLGIFLPIGAGIGALVGLATEQIALWVAIGSGLGVIGSLVLARSTDSDESP